MASNEVSVPMQEYWEGPRMAWLLGVSGRRLRQMVEEGIIEAKLVPNGKRQVRRYDPVAVTRQYYEYLHRDRRGQSSESSEEQKEKYEYYRAEWMKERSISAKYQNDIDSGRLIYIEEVEADYRRFFVAIKAFLLHLPAWIVGRLQGLVEPKELRQVEQEINSDIKEQLEGFVAAGCGPPQEEEPNRSGKRKPKTK